jgi:hypothetical protein
MVGRATALPDVMPELKQYLLRYPDADLPGADSFMYWDRAQARAGDMCEKIEFGMKPTIRVNHAVIYNVKAEGRDISVVAIKQLTRATISIPHWISASASRTRRRPVVFTS